MKRLYRLHLEQLERTRLNFIPDVEKYHEQSIVLLHLLSRRHNIPHEEDVNLINSEL
jgi:hypothetical protein